MNHCLIWDISCGTIAKGMGVFVIAVILFIGSVYILLSAVFGRWMGYLITMVTLAGWMLILSATWMFGFKSQGVTTPTNQGPRGSNPEWVILEAAPGATSDQYATFAKFPDAPWQEVGGASTAAPAPTTETTTTASTFPTSEDATATETAVQTFMAEMLNEEKKIEENDPAAYQPTAFQVDDVKFAMDGNTKLAVAESHFIGGGPIWTVSLYYDNGSVPRYSIMFLVGSIIVLLIHLPLLDRAEKKRKEFLTGGAAPAWHGPA